MQKHSTQSSFHSASIKISLIDKSRTGWTYVSHSNWKLWEKKQDKEELEFLEGNPERICKMWKRIKHRQTIFRMNIKTYSKLSAIKLYHFWTELFAEFAKCKNLLQLNILSSPSNHPKSPLCPFLGNFKFRYFVAAAAPFQSTSRQRLILQKQLVLPPPPKSARLPPF